VARNVCHARFAGRVAHFAKDQTSAGGAHFMGEDVAESMEYDLLVAADGVNSAVRALLERKGGKGWQITPATSSKRILNPLVLSDLACCDVVSNISQAVGAGTGAEGVDTDTDTDRFITVEQNTDEMLFKTMQLPVQVPYPPPPIKTTPEQYAKVGRCRLTPG